MIGRRGLLGVLLGAFLVLWTALPALAQDALTPFVGKWVALQSTSDASPTMAAVRSMSFRVDRDGNGFFAAWTQSRLERDKAADRTAQAIITRGLNFRLKPGANNVWIADGARDGTTDALAFARLLGNDTLVISTMMMTAQGDAELQLYERKVVGDQMFYSYRRFVGAKETSKLSVTLVKAPD